MPLSQTYLLDPSVRHERVDSAVRQLWSSHERSAYGLCLALHRLFRDQVHRGTGRSRFDVWAEDRYGIPRKLAGLFSWIGSKLEELPLTLAAMEEGEINYTKLREFVNLLTPENEAEWLVFARTHTNREIERHVKRKQRADGTETTKFTSELTATERQAARKARRKLMKMTGKSIRPSRLFAEMAKAIAESDLFGTADGERKAGGNGASAYVSIQPCPMCLGVYTPVPEGILEVSWRECFEAVLSGAEAFDQVAQFFCDCEGEKHRRDRCGNWKLPDPGPAKSRHVPVEVLRRIRARDGQVCRRSDVGPVAGRMPPGGLVLGPLRHPEGRPAGRPSG